MGAQCQPPKAPPPAPPPTPLSISPAGHGFGAPGEARQFAVTNNTGSATAALDTTVVPIKAPGNFTVSNDNCDGAPLPANATCTLLVTFGGPATPDQSALVNVSDGTNTASALLGGGTA
jgi:hypothetical protein